MYTPLSRRYGDRESISQLYHETESPHGRGGLHFFGQTILAVWPPQDARYDIGAPLFFPDFPRSGSLRPLPKTEFLERNKAAAPDEKSHGPGTQREPCK